MKAASHSLLAFATANTQAFVSRLVRYKFCISIKSEAARGGNSSCQSAFCGGDKRERKKMQTNSIGKLNAIVSGCGQEATLCWTGAAQRFLRISSNCYACSIKVGALAFVEQSRDARRFRILRCWNRGEELRDMHSLVCHTLHPSLTRQSRTTSSPSLASLNSNGLEVMWIPGPLVG